MTVSKKGTPIRYRVADSSGVTNTLEGPVHHEQGHYIITGPKGEEYPVAPQKFEQLYDVIGDETASPKQIKKQAREADHNGVVHASWGDLKYEKGKHIIVRHGPNDYGVVEKNIFNDTYNTHSHN